jgi:hypothetical protein
MPSNFTSNKTAQLKVEQSARTTFKLYPLLFVLPSRCINIEQEEDAMTINRTSFLQAPKEMFFLRSYCGANVFGQINRCARLSKTAVTFKLFTKNRDSLRRKIGLNFAEKIFI